MMLINRILAPFVWSCYHVLMLYGRNGCLPVALKHHVVLICSGEEGAMHRKAARRRLDKSNDTLTLKSLVLHDNNVTARRRLSEHLRCGRLLLGVKILALADKTSNFKGDRGLVLTQSPSTRSLSHQRLLLHVFHSLNTTASMDTTQARKSNLDLVNECDRYLPTRRLRN